VLPPVRWCWTAALRSFIVRTIEFWISKFAATMTGVKNWNFFRLGRRELTYRRAARPLFSSPARCRKSEMGVLASAQSLQADERPFTAPIERAQIVQLATER
jgi:hypothetical protein